MSAGAGELELRGLERRLALAYCSAFAAVLLACVLAAHAVLALALHSDEDARLADLVREAAGAYQHVRGGMRIDSDQPQLFDARTEGVAWYDGAGREVAREGAPPRPRAVRGGTVIVRSAVTPFGRVRVATGTARDASLLRRADLALAAGTLVALALAGAGGMLLARRALARVRAAVRTMRDFTADAAHELRGPLAALRGNAQASLRDGGALPAAHARRLATIDATARSMGGTVDDLLLLARAERPFGGDLHAIDVGACASAVVAARGELAAAAGVTLRAAVAARARAYGEPSEVERIVANLVDNALRHTAPGGAVDVACAAARGAVTVTVRDTGCGIAAEDLPRVFDRFWRGDPARAASAGSGLGLAIARALARRHGGDVAAESALGSGSVFTLTLPERPPRPA